jgi:cytochrome P450
LTRRRARNSPPESKIDFETARSNFYAAARDGLNSRVIWTDGREHMRNRCFLNVSLTRRSPAFVAPEFPPTKLTKGFTV